MTALLYCAVLLCLSGCLSATDTALEINGTVAGNTPGNMTAFGFRRECASDRDCYGGYRCSWAVCVPPGFTKPGVCPIIYYIVQPNCDKMHFVPCTDDSDCANDDKCCNNGCGLECMDPLKVKPGVCPRRQYEERRCPLIRFRPCSDDSECPKNDKCCNNGCGLQCMAPIKAKPGVCPRRKYEAGICALIRFKPCADDSDCAKNDKCCNNGCGRQCMAPVKAVPW